MDSKKINSSKIARVAFVFCCLLLCSSSQLIAATLISSQNFESTDWKSQFKISDANGIYTRVTNAPHAGAYSLRWNQHKTRVDPITGKANDPTSTKWLDWRGNFNIISQTPHGMFFRMWYRHDDYVNTKSTDGVAKMIYLVDNTYGVESMILTRQNGYYNCRLAYSNGSYSEQWAIDNWGYSHMYLNFNGATKGLDGRWRKVELYFNYDEHYVQIWFDGILATPGTGTNIEYWDLYPDMAAAGKIKWDPNLNLHFKGFQIFYYASDRDLESPADRTGYYAGVQVDDLEVWDGFPNDITSTLNFQINGDVIMKD